MTIAPLESDIGVIGPAHPSQNQSRIDERRRPSSPPSTDAPASLTRAA
jgi:hypothetical protein